MKQDYQSQLDDLKKWATANNFEIVNVFSEKVSAYNPKAKGKAQQTEYQKMKEYVIEKGIKHIAIWEISRLSRSLSKFKVELDFFTDHNINIFFKKENVNSLSQGTMDKFVLNVVGSMAEMESDNIRERTERGREGAVKNGKMVCFATYPYGYGVDTSGVIKIDETEAKVVRMIYDLAIKGETLGRIAAHLNSTGVPTRLKLKGRTIKYKNGSVSSALWTPVTVTKILKRPLYKGIRTYKDIEVPVPIVIPGKDWDLVQQRFNDHIGYLNHTKHDYLFKSKMRCSKCGRMIVTHIKRSNNTKYYECEGGKKINNKCPSPFSINIDLIDKYLYEALFSHTYTKEILTYRSSQALQKDEMLKQIDYYGGEITKLEAEVRMHKRFVLDQFETYDVFKKEMTTINNSITEIRNKISLLQTEIQTISKVDIDDIVNTYKTSTDYEMKREFVLKYVNGIKIYKVDGANVNWPNTLYKDEKILYFEILAFNFSIPLKVIITPHSKNVIVSKDLQLLPDYNIVVDTNKKGAL
jgi:DNA invertase Pin-like site-specific DNA recombinase